MLVVLPPSETKRDGGADEKLDFDTLAYSELNSRRRLLVRALRSLAHDSEATITALKLGPKQHSEIGRNLTVTSSATMPVLDRYTGVLYDALDAVTLTPNQRDFAASHVAVHSALFGLVKALDPIPAYRLSHDSRIPDMPLKKHWGTANAEALASETGLILDFRSEAYVALGPAPKRDGSYFLRVVTDSGGRRRALNHFNKKSKGEFARAIIENSRDFRTASELISWATAAGYRLDHGAAGELELVVDEVVASKRG
ncbi:YaaA family protein [Leifsonia sp. A12D58]|uniref:YaaA family protein n=1 Tax=Leifsonia sp. A12D58 TaxID=3397674 RepID=UPI0039E1D5ED